MEKISNDSITMGGSPNGMVILWYTSGNQGKMSKVTRIIVKDEKERLFSSVCQFSAQSWWEGIGSDWSYASMKVTQSDRATMGGKTNASCCGLLCHIKTMRT